MNIDKLKIGSWYMLSPGFPEVCQHIDKYPTYVAPFGFQFLDGLEVCYNWKEIEQWMTPCSKSFSKYLDLFALDRVGDKYPE